MATAIFGRPTFSVAYLSADSVRATESTKRPFRSIQDAISSFLDLIDPAIKLIQTNVQSKYVGIEPEAVAEQTRLLGLMDDWQLSFEHLMHNESTRATRQSTNGYNVMLACTMSVRVWLEACLSPQETVWDNYKKEFEEMVQLAEPVTYDDLRFPDEFSKSFSFELGIIPPLQFVAWKCRWPKIRRKALQLLRNAPRRECVFDSSYSYALYERVRILEESALKLGQGEEPGDDQVPPEDARIHVIDLPPLAPTTSGRAVNFLSRTVGGEGAWIIRSEILQLNDLELVGPYEERVSEDHVETSTTSLWSPSTSQSDRSRSAGDGQSTDTFASASDRATATEERAMLDEGYLKAEASSYRCSALRPVMADTTTDISIPIGARANHYAAMQIPTSPRSVG